MDRTRILSQVVPGILLPGFLVLLFPLAVYAQLEGPTPESKSDETSIPLIHTVAEGENLTYIAEQYGVTVEALLLINQLIESDVLSVGQQIVIPGGEGEHVATVYAVQLGDTLPHIAARFNTTVEEVVATNNLVNPTSPLRMGQTLAVVSRTGSTQPQIVAGQPHVVAPGESLLMIAARYGLSPLMLADANGLSFPSYVFEGQRIRIPGVGEYRDLPGGWLDVQVRPLPIVQGSTVSIYVENLLDGRPTGQFAGQSLHFAPRGNGYVALVGLDAFTAPGYHSLVLSSPSERPGSLFQQEIPVQAANYETQSITVGEDLNMLLDPKVRAAEDTLFASIYGRFSEPQRWEGLFQLPLTRTVVTAPYGVGRSYNNGPVDIYHTGIDFAETAGVSVLAPATGTVVFVGQLDVRGRTLIIDHGLGVMSGYYHLADIFVEEGDTATSGQEIASVGTTGLSTGPHLHWDVRIMNMPVDGFQWTKEVFP